MVSGEAEIPWDLVVVVIVEMALARSTDSLVVKITDAAEKSADFQSVLFQKNREQRPLQDVSSFRVWSVSVIKFLRYESLDFHILITVN